MSFLVLQQSAQPPVLPGANKVVIWYNSDGRIKTIDNSNNVYTFITPTSVDVLQGKTLGDATDGTKAINLSMSGMTTGKTLTLASIQSTTQTLTIPNITGADTLVTLGLAHTFLAANTFQNNGLLILNPASTFSYLIQAAAIGAARTLNLPLITQTETLAIQPQNVYFSPANPALTTSLVGVMMGLSAGATRITPRVTGRLLIIITGQATSSVAGDGCAIQSYIGTGNGPANGAALTGTALGSLQHFIASSTTAGEQGWVICVIASSLAIGTAIWIDIGLAAITGGNANIYGIDVAAIEF